MPKKTIDNMPKLHPELKGMPEWEGFERIAGVDYEGRNLVPPPKGSDRSMRARSVELYDM